MNYVGSTKIRQQDTGDETDACGRRERQGARGGFPPNHIINDKRAPTDILLATQQIINQRHHPKLLPDDLSYVTRCAVLLGIRAGGEAAG